MGFTPRFSVGSCVECLVEEGWSPGVVDRIWWRQPEWGNEPTAPYNVTLNDGRSIVAPRDSDDLIRRCGWSSSKLILDASATAHRGEANATANRFSSLRQCFSWL